jgi:hypothetical protein
MPRPTANIAARAAGGRRPATLRRLVETARAGWLMNERVEHDEQAVPRGRDVSWT